jgi:hypothetical protein
MNIALTVVCVAGIIYFMFIRPQLRQRRERAIQAQRDAHFNMLVKGIDKLAKRDPTVISEPTAHPVASEQQELFADIREYWGYPPKRDQVLEEIFSGDQVGGDWDYAVHIHEGAEQYLGSELFLGLEKRFASVPGVDKCKHEDREVFLIRAKTLSVDALRSGCWTQFLQAAEMVFGKEGKGAVGGLGNRGCGNSP